MSNHPNRSRRAVSLRWMGVARDHVSSEAAERLKNDARFVPVCQYPPGVPVDEGEFGALISTGRRGEKVVQRRLVIR